MTLHDGARVAIIGGGPAGSFFCIFASQLARDMGKALDLTIYERKSFANHGASGCNMCAGVISESLVQALALEGINLPSTVVQWGIESYFFHTEDGSVEIKSSRLRQRGIATVFRGGGPAGSLAKGIQSFDDFLLQKAVDHGACVNRSFIDRHHDALLVKKDSGEQIFFIGDSFTPSGIDDYSMLNRNFLHEGMGYLSCLELIKRVAPDALLINEHVAPTFRFSVRQLDEMRDVLKQRRGLLQALLPWDDPNFGLDEGWARFHPYAPKVHPGEKARLALRVRNHSPKKQTFTIEPHLPEGWTLSSAVPIAIPVPAREEGAAEVTFKVPEDARAGIQLLTADISWGDWELREWTEAMVSVTSR